jgi:predicted SprT family Zn-dependent metalloprotease
MSRELIEFSNQFAFSRGDEHGYICTACERKVNRRESFSKSGKGLICYNCAGRMAKAEGLPLSTWLRIKR